MWTAFIEFVTSAPFTAALHTFVVAVVAAFVSQHPNVSGVLGAILNLFKGKTPPAALLLVVTLVLGSGAARASEEEVTAISYAPGFRGVATVEVAGKGGRIVQVVHPDAKFTVNGRPVDAAGLFQWVAAGQGTIKVDFGCGPIAFSRAEPQIRVSCVCGDSCKCKPGEVPGGEGGDVRLLQAELHMRTGQEERRLHLLPV